MHKDKRENYWFSDEPTENPCISKICLHTNFGNVQVNEYSDKLSKKRSVIYYYLPKFIKVYNSSQELSLDDKYHGKGRCNASKIVKYAILIPICVKV